MRRLYFDHNASTPIDPRVLERWLEVVRQVSANPGSLHTSGRAARGVLEDARDELAQSAGLRADDVIFVSGGTEADNLAVRTLGDPTRAVLCAALEHPAVFDAALQRGRVALPIDAAGYAVFDRAGLPGSSAPIGLLAIVHGQNEIGTVQDIVAAATLARDLGVPLHVDAAQTVGRVPLSEVVASSDTIAISAHKFGGPAGVGALLGRGVRTLTPLSMGGGQEYGLRAGTEDVAGAAACARAFRLAIDETAARAAAMRALRIEFERAIEAVVSRRFTPELTADARPSLPNTTMCAFEGVPNRSLLPALDLAGVEASVGSACSSGSPLPPRVLAAMQVDEALARTCVRFSFSHHTSLDDVREGAARVVEVVHRLRRG